LADGRTQQRFDLRPAEDVDGRHPQEAGLIAGALEDACRIG
jgi:hypothetical protein